ALKTAPAFEAALYAGLRLAGPAEAYEKMVGEFSKHLGIAFQILNDLKDWDGDSDNKLLAGQDVLAARPTLLLALALEGSAPAGRPHPWSNYPYELSSRPGRHRRSRLVRPVPAGGLHEPVRTRAARPSPAALPRPARPRAPHDGDR